MAVPQRHRVVLVPLFTTRVRCWRATLAKCYSNIIAAATGAAPMKPPSHPSLPPNGQGRPAAASSRSRSPVPSRAARHSSSPQPQSLPHRLTFYSNNSHRSFVHMSEVNFYFSAKLIRFRFEIDKTKTIACRKKSSWLIQPAERRRALIKTEWYWMTAAMRRWIKHYLRACMRTVETFSSTTTWYANPILLKLSKKKSDYTNFLLGTTYTWSSGPHSGARSSWNRESFLG